MTAAMAMLDEIHGNGQPQIRNKNDDNSYVLGQIGNHNVVIACLPAGDYGTTSAATVANQLLSSFSSIKVGFMVGVGGGIPSEKNDIRLGDVVVSTPGHTSGAVVQYDLGKVLPDGEFSRRGSLNKPPRVILNAVNRLRSEHLMTGNTIAKRLMEFLETYPDSQAIFSNPGADQDQLFDTAYAHPLGASTCVSCDKSRLVKREPRETMDPVIHYGPIASGNSVIKDGVVRDQLGNTLGVLCFEMEAAGLMDNFPCLVARGICDYSDSHKNKMWQGYAAFTAAAYTKELLGALHAKATEDLPAVQFRYLIPGSVFYFTLGYTWGWGKSAVLPDGVEYYVDGGGGDDDGDGDGDD
jgi:nucleoside phosphorylase